MALAPGTRLGAYEITAKIGQGGMGEVYRARDTKLGRDVALKVLPDSFASDPERLARFQREAQVLASLNHPNIAALYHIGDAPHPQSPLPNPDLLQYLVMELVEGPTLQEMLAGSGLSAVGSGKNTPASQGQRPKPTAQGLTVEDALPIAKQIAEALEAAHEQGIIHRDLKPANIKVRPDGLVKVLDFGLAKALEPAGSKLQDPAYALSQAPTITTPAMMTGVGVILGTAAYMSPEQAKGRETDKRSDVWAFGCVLYEMLTGKRAFEAEDVSETLAMVLRGEPDWSALPPHVPASVVALVRRCLTKDRKRRIADMSTALFVIDDPAALGPANTTPVRVDRPRLWRRALPAVAAVLLVAATAAIVWNVRPSPQPVGLTRFPILLPEGEMLTNTGSHAFAMSPDGTNIVYAANQQLYIRNLAEMEARPIPGTAQAAEEPFFSPDGRWLGFYASAERKLKKIAIAGGASVTICDADYLYGASWTSDDRIVFGQGVKGILQVSANGGKPVTLFAAQSVGFAHGPQILPGGDALLFTLALGRTVTAWDRAQVVVQSLGSGERRVVIESGSDARYIPTGHIVYAVGSTVSTVPFDVRTLQVTGGPVPIIEGTRRAPSGTTGAAQFGASDNGTMAYIPGQSAERTELTLALVDRAGARTPLNIPPGAHGQPRVSPSGRQLALHTADGRGLAIWIDDLTGSAASMRRLTFQGANDKPTWTPDGERIVFRSDREGDNGLFWQRADGSGSADRLAKAEEGATLQSEAWSPDGKTLIFSVGRGPDRSLSMLGADRKPTPLIAAYASNSSLSPDGRWLAYFSLVADFSGQEVYVQPFPLTGAKYLVSSGGSVDPLWSPDGKQLFYLQRKGAGWQIVSVDVQTQPSFVIGRPIPLPIEGIARTGPRTYDITPDGKHFVVMFPKSEVNRDKAPRDQINVTLNWFEELKAKAPAK